MQNADKLRIKGIIFRYIYLKLDVAYFYDF